MSVSRDSTLPSDRFAGTLVGRVWDPAVRGPSPVVVREDGVYDVSDAFPTVRDLCESPDPAGAVRAVQGRRLGGFADILANTDPSARSEERPGNKKGPHA